MGLAQHIEEGRRQPVPGLDPLAPPPVDQRGPGARHDQNLMFRTALTGWQAQYDRFERSYARINGDFQSSLQYMDDLHHFMQDCWHLKDWIKNDPALDVAVRRSVDRAVHRHRALRIVADLANAAKHLSRTDSPEHADVASQGLDAQPAQDKKIDIECTVELGNGSVWTIQRVITDAYRDWHTVLADMALIPRR